MLQLIVGNSRHVIKLTSCFVDESRVMCMGYVLYRAPASLHSSQGTPRQSLHRLGEAELTNICDLTIY